MRWLLQFIRRVFSRFGGAAEPGSSGDAEDRRRSDDRRNTSPQPKAAKDTRDAELSAREVAMDQRPVSPSVSPWTPSTLKAELSNPHLVRPIMFDPALKKHFKAHRAGEPRFDSVQDADEWHAARATVLHHALVTICDLDVKHNLILRGSMLLKVWFGDTARRPGDLDWVITPESWRIDQWRSWRMIRRIIRGAPRLVGQLSD